MSDVVTPTPGKCFMFQVNGHQFGFRWPSQADLDHAARLQAARLTVLAGYTEGEARIASETLGLLNGTSIEWECRLAVGLLPRRRRDGALFSVGEKAPDHWLAKQVVAGVERVEVSFDEVDPDEFDEVCRLIGAAEAERRKKKAGPPAPSTPTAPAPTSD